MSWRIIQGDCRDVMRGMEAGSVHCVITSPPYWKLRDYGFDGQLGLEETPDEYIAVMVDVFREVKRVLRSDGTLWVNIGDCYVGNSASGGTGHRVDGGIPYRIGESHIKPGVAGNLVGIPWRLAFALQADGWILRRDIIWSKPNPMPESVNGWRWERCRVKVAPKNRDTDQTYAEYVGMEGHSGNSYRTATWQDCDGCPKCKPNGGLVLRKGSGRCTTAHEYLFQFAKTGEYFYDCEAVKEKSAGGRERFSGDQYGSKGLDGTRNDYGRLDKTVSHERNRRSVWEIATQPYPEAHFATYPEALVEPCIKAGTSERGCCPDCGAPWVRILEPSEEAKARLGAAWHDHKDDLGQGQRGTPPALKGPANITKGWRPSCEHNGEPVPSTVFDMFTGSGVSGVAAVKLGRDFIGAELSAEYIELAGRRIFNAAEKYGRLTAEMPAKKHSQLGLL